MAHMLTVGTTHPPLPPVNSTTGILPFSVPTTYPPVRPLPQTWRPSDPDVDVWPIGEDLEAFDLHCNFRDKNGMYCSKRVVLPKQLGFLPMCKTHKRRKIRAGRCRAVLGNRRACGQIIRWKAPYNEVCNEHSDVMLQCHLLSLPKELRMLIFRYLLPDLPISSMAAALLRADSRKSTLSLLLVNRQIHQDASDVLYGSVPFNVRISKGGVLMCGQLIHDLLPNIYYSPPQNIQSMSRRADGSDTRFRKNFNFTKLRNMRIQICLHKPYPPGRRSRDWWDEEIELYNLRDGVQALVKVLKRCSSLHTLEVVITICGFDWPNTPASWTHDSALKLLTQPFADHLSSIARPRLHHIHHKANGHLYPEDSSTGEQWPSFLPIPQSPQHSSFHQTQEDTEQTKITTPNFAEYKRTWEAALSRRTPPSPDLQDAQQRLNELYAEFESYYDDVSRYYNANLPRGRVSLLHRARVAREDRDEEALKAVRAELLGVVKGYVNDDMKSLAARMCRLKKSEEMMLGVSTDGAEFKNCDEDQLLHRYGAEVLGKLVD